MVPTGGHQLPRLVRRAPEGNEFSKGLILRGRSKDNKWVFWALCEQLREAKAEADGTKDVVCMENSPKQKQPDSNAPFKPPRVPEK